MTTATLRGLPLAAAFAQPRTQARGLQQQQQRHPVQRSQRRQQLAALVCAAAEAGPEAEAAAPAPPLEVQQRQQQQLEADQQQQQQLGAEQQQQQANTDGSSSGNGAEPCTSGREEEDACAAPAAAPHGARVVVRSMVKHFKTRRGLFRAVNGVDVEMAPGTITALLGPSGSGKTTLLRLIAGLEEPTEGRVFFDGDDITAFEVQDRDLGFVFQGYALFKHMNVNDNITFGPRMRKMDIDLDAKVEELLQLTGLPGLGGRYPPQLSGGQRQRVAVARALACNPRLMLLDEPFGALDPLVRKSLRHGLRDIVKKLGVTTIIVTHDQEEAWDIADQVVIFNKGIIEQRGTPQEIAKAPVSPFVMNFVGDVNHVTATCQLVRKMGFQTSKPYVMCRPGDITVHKDFEVAPNAVPATVHDKANVGRVVRYYLRFDDGVEVDFAATRQQDELLYDLDVGQRVFVEVPPAAMMGFDYPDIDGTAVTI